MSRQSSGYFRKTHFAKYADMTNHLVQSQSVYFLNHAENPIVCWSWTNESGDRDRLSEIILFGTSD
jgi:hypothetical protein